MQFRKIGTCTGPLLAASQKSLEMEQFTAIEDADRRIREERVRDRVRWKPHIVFSLKRSV